MNKKKLAVKKVFVFISTIFALITFSVVAFILLTTIKSDLGWIMCFCISVITLSLCLYMLFSGNQKKYGLMITFFMVVLFVLSLLFWVTYLTQTIWNVALVSSPLAIVGALVSAFSIAKLSLDSPKSS